MKVTTVFLCYLCLLLGPAAPLVQGDIPGGIHADVAAERYTTARCLTGSTVERFDDRGYVPLRARRKCLV